MIEENKLIEDIEKEFDGVCVYDVSPSQAIADFVDIVDRQPKVGEWIPCSERLPAESIPVLTCDKTGWVSVNINIPYHGKKNPFECGYYTAWMPLPTPYNAERGGKNE